MHALAAPLYSTRLLRGVGTQNLVYSDYGLNGSDRTGGSAAFSASNAASVPDAHSASDWFSQFILPPAGQAIEAEAGTLWPQLFDVREQPRLIKRRRPLRFFIALFSNIERHKLTMNTFVTAPDRNIDNPTADMRRQRVPSHERRLLLECPRLEYANVPIGRYHFGFVVMPRS